MLAKPMNLNLKGLIIIYKMKQIDNKRKHNYEIKNVIIIKFIT